jgi:uncharacterized protein (TIGR00369 family)
VSQGRASDPRNPSRPFVLTLPHPQEDSDADPRMYPGAFALSGFEQLKWTLGGKSGRAPVERLVGVRFEELAPGKVGYRNDITDWLQWEEGRVPAGALAILADAAHSGAGYTKVGPITGFVTVDASLSFTRPVTLDDRRLRAVGEVRHMGQETMLSQVVVEDDAGELICQGSSRSSLFRFMEEMPTPPPDMTLMRDATIGMEPFTLETRGEGFPLDLTCQIDGLELLHKLIAREIPEPPLCHLTGVRPVRAGKGTCAFVLPASPWFGSPLGTVQGGALAMLAERSMWGAAMTCLPVRSTCRTLDLTISYARPVPCDGAELSSVGETVRLGRKFGNLAAQVTDANGRSVAYATATVAITKM